MPLIALDDVPRLIQQHQKYPFLTKEAQEVLSAVAHPVVNSLGIKSLWQLLTFSSRELTEELSSMGVQLGKDTELILGSIAESLSPYSLNLRENAPYALRTSGKDPKFVKTVTETTHTLAQFYEDTTLYWTRWAAFRAASKLAQSFPKLQVVFRSETLKLGGAPLRP